MSSDDDPTCPECGEPVSATATYCMHCYADLPWADDGGSGGETGDSTESGAGSDGDDGVDPAGLGSEVVDSIIGDEGDDAATDRAETADARPSATDDGGSAAEDEILDDDEYDVEEPVLADDEPGSDAEPQAGDTGGVSSSTGTAVDPTEGGTTGEDAGSDELLDPEGLVDNTLTVLVAIAGSIVIGLVGTFALLLITGSVWALLAGLFAWLGGLAYLARQYSVQETVAKTFFGVAVVLLLLPLVAVSPAFDGGVGDRLVVFGSLLVTVGVPAAVAAGIGFAVLWFAPDPE